MSYPSTQEHETAPIDPANEETQRRAQVVAEMQDFVGEQLDLLLPVDRSWQPTDFLPDPAAENWLEQVAELKTVARELPDGVLVTLIGDMITEEALPSYQTMLNRFEGMRDSTGDDISPWGRWSRGWTAEENRHGDLLNRFLYLIGRVDMRAVEVTIHNLIKKGFNAGAGADPYLGFIYTSFQERATKISHSNVAQLAKRAGNQVLSKICQVIAGDEARHEEAYKRFMGRIFEIDPEGAVLAFRDMMKRTVAMPARLMDDGRETDLFKKFAAIAQRIGVYTAHDYAEIIDHLVERWHVPSLEGLRGEAAKAQDYLASLGERYRKLADRLESKIPHPKSTRFSWIYDRAV